MWAETAKYAGGAEKCGSGTISIAGLTVKVPNIRTYLDPDLDVDGDNSKADYEDD